MHRHRRLLLPSLSLVLLLGLVVLLRPSLDQLILRPAALFLWAFWRAVISVDQRVYWTLLLAACLILSLRLLPSEGQAVARPDYHYRRPHRAAYWRDLVKRGSRRAEDREALRSAVRAMLLSVLAQTERLAPEDVEQQVRSGLLPVPTEVRDFLFSAATGKGKRSPAPPHDPVGKILSWLKQARWKKNDGMSEVLTWMESRMEISNDQ